MDTISAPSEIAAAIHSEARRIGFTACGFASVSNVPDTVWNKWNDWIKAGKHDKMSYMERYGEIRRNPTGLLPEARTVISVALNYYPKVKQPRNNPRFAYYAYGDDYHDIMRSMLGQLQSYITTLAPSTSRICCDTAPIFERYWAVQAGIGYIGRNSQLIIPHQGSCFFLGELLTSLSLPPSKPLETTCGNCRKCIDACPVKAIDENGNIDARRCISCQTIENKGEIPPETAQRLGYRVYGCDTCQDVCPHNANALPSEITALQPHSEFFSLTYKRLKQLTPEEFRHIFRHSAIQRAKYSGLMRNVDALDATLFEQ